MNVLTYTLLTDGPSDKRLLPLITWCLRSLTDSAVNGTWADMWVVRPKPISLRDRIRAAAEYYPASVLFVHRDSENASHDQRLEEIRDAAVGLAIPIVEIVTVRMQEAWFLFDESAIRAAAGNPHGAEPLHLPKLAALETIPDPQALLSEALKRASGLSGRHLRRFSPSKAAHRVAELIGDFSPLNALSAFAAYRERTAAKIAAIEEAL